MLKTCALAVIAFLLALAIGAGVTKTLSALKVDKSICTRVAGGVIVLTFVTTFMYGSLLLPPPDQTHDPFVREHSAAKRRAKQADLKLLGSEIRVAFIYGIFGCAMTSSMFRSAVPIIVLTAAFALFGSLVGLDFKRRAIKRRTPQQGNV